MWSVIVVWCAAAWDVIRLVPVRFYLVAALGLACFCAGCHCGRVRGGEFHDPAVKAALPKPPPAEEVVVPQAAGPGLAAVRRNLCPVTGQSCPCGCKAGAPCNCAAGARWHFDAAGSRDLGLWQGERFLGRWFAAERVYRGWTGARYGPPEEAPIPLPKPPPVPLPVAATPAYPPHPTPGFRPLTFFGLPCRS